MNTPKLHTHRCSFNSVKVGEFFQWGDRNGEIYVKIRVQKYRALSAREKKEGKSIYDIPTYDRFTFSYTALNIKTYETNYDISGGNVQCVRLRGHMTVEAHQELNT